MQIRSNLRDRKREAQKNGLNDVLREKNTALKNAINGRKDWVWVPNHGGYAQYYAGKRRIGIVNMARDGGEDFGKYDAELVGMPYNSAIKYGIADATEIIETVERYFA